MDKDGGHTEVARTVPRHLGPSNVQVGVMPLPPGSPSTAPGWAARRPLDSKRPPLWVPGHSAPPKINRLLRLCGESTPGDPRRTLDSVSERGLHQFCFTYSSFQKLHRNHREPDAGEPAGRASHQPGACTPGPLRPKPHVAPPVAQRGPLHPSAGGLWGLGHSSTREAGGTHVLRQYTRIHSHTLGGGGGHQCDGKTHLLYWGVCSIRKSKDNFPAFRGNTGSQVGLLPCHRTRASTQRSQNKAHLRGREQTSRTWMQTSTCAASCRRVCMTDHPQVAGSSRGKGERTLLARLL